MSEFLTKEYDQARIEKIMKFNRSFDDMSQADTQ